MLTHIDQNGSATMIDVSDKLNTDRLATAIGSVTMQQKTIKLIQEGLNKKGDVLTVAKIAGIQAAKNCSNLIPLCHPLILTAIDLQLSVDAIKSQIKVSCTCKLNAKTGVEMEALTAVSIATLTIYDMCKAVDRSMIIGNICLQTKTGGKSGDYHAD